MAGTKHTKEGRRGWTKFATKVGNYSLKNFLTNKLAIFDQSKVQLRWPTKFPTKVERIGDLRLGKEEGHGWWMEEELMVDGGEPEVRNQKSAMRSFSPGGGWKGGNKR